MNKDNSFTTIGDEPIEARIVAWVLGEASGFEAAELERLCEERPELLLFRRRMIALHGLLTEAETAKPADGWKLPPEKRKPLDEISGQEKVVNLEDAKEKRIRRAGIKAFFAIAACVVLAIVVLQLVHPIWVKQTIHPAAKSVDFMPAACGEPEQEESRFSGGAGAAAVADRTEFNSPFTTPNAEAQLKSQASPARQPLTTTLPPELIEGTPKPINVPNLETPVNGPAGHSSMAQSKKKREASAPSPAENEASKVVSADPFADEKPDSSLAASEDSPATPATRSPRPRLIPPPRANRVFAEGAASSFTIPDSGDNFGEMSALDSLSGSGPSGGLGGSGGDKGAGKGWGGKGDENGRQSDEDSLKLNNFSGKNTYTGGTSIAAGTLRDHVVGFTGDLTEDGKDATPDKVPTLGDVPVVGQLFLADSEKKKELQLPEVTTRSGDFKGIVNFGSPILTEAGKADASGVGQDARATVARASRPEPSSPAEVPASSPLTDEHRQNVDDVRRSLYKAEGNLNLGKYDAAKKEYENTLRTDPYNVAARRGLEKVAAAKSDYYRAAYDHTRAELLTEVDKAWELAVPADKEGKKANIEIVRESKPPTEYEPPTLSSQTAAGGKAGQSDPAKADADGDTSIVTKSGKQSGGVEYELHNGYSSEDLYRGKDLKGDDHVSNSKSDVRHGGSDPDSLRKAIRDQEDKVEERRKLLATIVNTKGIIYKGADSYYNKSDVDEDQGARSALQEFEKLESDRMRLQSQVKSLQKYDKDQLMTYASGLDLPDNVVRNTLPQYQEAQRKLEALKIEGLGKEHPTLKAQIAQTETLKKQLDEGVVNLRATLNAQLDIADNRLKEVEKRKDEFREAAIKRGLDAQDYVDAKRDFEKDQALLQQLKLKLASSTKVPEPEKPKIDLTKLMEEISASEDPYSTFSLNISDASFKVAQAALAKGERPDPAGIKVEQFYNAVDYGDPSPQNGQPVAVNIEQSAHPVIPGRNLVRVALKTAAAGRSAAQPLRLTLLVDQSGSMVREDRRAAMDKALASLSGLLTKNDLVTVIGFSRTPRLLATGMKGDQAGKLKDLVNQAANEGGTNLELAMNVAAKKAMEYKTSGAQNRIVLFTDGAANLGDADPARLAEKVKSLRQSGIAFDIAGIAADELNDDLLGELARNGNGRYYVVGKGNDQDLGKQLAGAFRPAAENVKVQVHFNPERVARYKLIGFEKDRLKTEDFRNDAVDAAELAAEEAGVAIYQVETLPGGSGEIGEVSVRFRDTAAGQMVERTWAIPHDAKAPAIDRATPSMQLAVLSMLAAEKLKGGPLGEAIDFKQLVDTRANVRRFYGNTGRSAEMLQVIDAIK